MSNKIVHFEIMGKDATKSQRFYADLFDWSVKADKEYNYGMVDAGDAGIGGGIGAEPGGGTRVTFYAVVDDLDAYLKRAESLGGKTIMPPMEMGGVNLAQLADPDGNIVGLVKG